MQAAFRELCTDPVTVDGAESTAADLVARARAVQGVFARLGREVFDVVEADGKVAGGRISASTMVADELGALAAVGAVRLPGEAQPVCSSV